MDDLIYNQTKIPKEKWRYGFRASAKVGCGWIATYNALRLMGYRMDIHALIRCYERQLPLINGNAGTLFCGPALLMRKWGFDVDMTANPRRFDALCRNSDVGILFYYWRDGLRFGSHFVAVRYSNTGFIGYNTYVNSNGPDAYGSSLKAFLKKRKYFGAILIGIRKKRPLLPTDTIHPL